MTAETESEVRVFLLFLKLPKINLTEVYTFVATKRHSDTIAEMMTVKICQINASENTYELPFDRIVEQSTKLEKEATEVQEERNRLVDDATMHY